MTDSDALRRLAAFEIRELLVRSLGWHRYRAAAAERGTPHLTPLATRAGVTAYRHQTPIGGRFPDYARRRALRDSLGPGAEHALIVFTDLLRTTQVWQWTEHAPPRPSAYREQSYFAARPETAPLALLARIPATAPPPLPHLDPAAVRTVAAVLLPALRRRARTPRDAVAPPEAGEPHVALQREIEACAAPERLRALWRALAGGPGPRGGVGVAVLGCGEGGGAQLLAALEVLEPLYLACLQRMQCWLDDAQRARHAERPERTRASRAVLERASDATRYPSPQHFVRGRIVRDNLYGALPSDATLGQCRAALLGALHALPGAALGWPATEPNLCVGSVTDAGAARRARPLPEALELAARAADLLRAREDAPDADAAELAGARAALGEWRRAAGVGGVEALEVAFPHVMRRGGFDVVLGLGTESAPARVREPGARYALPSPAKPVSPMLPDTLSRLSAADPAYPALLRQRLGALAPGALTLRGSAEPLRRPLLALFCSQRVPGSLIVRGFDLARRLRDQGVPVIGGFHSALEREWLDVLLRGTAPVVLCPARAIEPIRRLPRALRAPLGEGRLSILSGFAPTQRRASRAFAQARNRLVAALAERVFIAHADPGGTLFLLAREVMGWGVPVLTFDDPRNADLLLLGARALPADALPVESVEAVMG